jgi:hypothetical protein
MSSCRKDDLLEIPPPPEEPLLCPTFTGPYDTIFPEPYLPIYPGSNWVYVDSNNNYVTTYQATGYDLVANHDEDCCPAKPYYLPTYDRASLGSAHLSGYDLYSGTATFNQVLGYLVYPFNYICTNRLVSDNLNETIANRCYYEEFGNFNWCYRTRVAQVDYQMEFQNVLYSDVIVVEQNLEVPSFPNPLTTTVYYYIKDIGLVKEEYFEENGDTSLIMILDQWFINN